MDNNNRLQCKRRRKLNENESSESEDDIEKRKFKKEKMPKFCHSWLSEPIFKDWLIKGKKKDETETETAYCKVCKSNIIAHKSAIKRHANSDKHKSSIKKTVELQKITDIFMTSTLEEQVRTAEIKLCGMLTTNNLPFLLMDTLSPILSNIFPDSNIAKRIAVKRTKATTIVNETLGKSFLKDLSNILKEPGRFFSIIMDESTDCATLKQCAFTIIFMSDDESLVTKFFDIVELTGGSANDLFDALITTITSKGIPLENLVGFASDTPNVMTGMYQSVFALLKKEIPDIVCIKCSCHMIHLAASKACLVLPRSVEDLLRNVGSHFSRSPARQQRFKEFQEFFQAEIHKILNPAITRWLSLKACVDRVLEQFEPLRAYFRVVLMDDPSVTTDTILVTMENQFTKIYLEFMAYVLGLLTDFNLLFQSDKPLLFRVKPETEKLLKTLCSNYMKICFVRGGDILTLNHKNPTNFVPAEQIYLGVEATHSLQAIKLTADKIALKTFFDTIIAFYIELVTQIKHRFQFEDPIYNIIKIVEPTVVLNAEIKSLQPVMNRFPILRNHVQSIQLLDNEWRDLSLEDFSLYDTTNVDKFWSQVFNAINAAGMKRFPNVKRVISLLQVLPFSNASVERVFSDLFNIKTDKRNLLATKTLKSILISKDGIESLGGCVKFTPTKEMINSKIWHKL